MEDIRSKAKGNTETSLNAKADIFITWAL